MITIDTFAKAGSFYVVDGHKFVAQEPKRYQWQDKNDPLHQLWVADTCSWKVIHASRNGKWMYAATSNLDSTLFSDNRLSVTRKAVKRHNEDMVRARNLLAKYESRD